MKLLLDHCVDRRLARSLTAHEVHTAAEMGWEALRNGALLAEAAAKAFGAVLTTDTSLQFQQNLKTLPVSVVVLRGATNRLVDLLPLLPLVESSLATLGERQIVEVGQSGEDAS